MFSEDRGEMALADLKGFDTSRWDVAADSKVSLDWFWIEGSLGCRVAARVFAAHGGS